MRADVNSLPAFVRRVPRRKALAIVSVVLAFGQVTCLDELVQPRADDPIPVIRVSVDGERFDALAIPGSVDIPPDMWETISAGVSSSIQAAAIKIARGIPCTSEQMRAICARSSDAGTQSVRSRRAICRNKAIAL